MNGYTPFFLMFGRQARIPVDVMYGTPTFSAQSVNECTAALCKQLDSAFINAQRHSLSSHLQQKELYNRNVHGKPLKKGDLVWLHSPLSKRGVNKKLYHPWSGPYKIVKKLSNANYKIEHLQGRKNRKIVHFDRLKLCPANIHLNEKPADEEEEAKATTHRMYHQKLCSKVSQLLLAKIYKLWTMMKDL